MSVTVTKIENPIWRDWLKSATTPGIGAIISLTIIGGVLRLIRLSHPPLLYDEAATYTRVVGSFREMIETLRFDGFPPVHYELYWLMARIVRLTPWMMRIVPALAGTLMIPAIYFLARQMFSRRVATLAAAITCFSAYMLVYSRDAKMYMELWLLATLFIACLLLWMRTQSRIAWLAWVACACAMNGLQGLGLCVTGVGLVIVLLHPRLTTRKLLWAIAGCVIACVGLLGYFLFFNRWGQSIYQTGWHASGLEWIDQRGSRMGRLMVLWDTLVSWMLAYRSPRPPITAPSRVIQPVAIVSGILIVLLILGAMPWPKRLRDDDEDDSLETRGPLWMALWVVLPSIGFALASAIGGHDLFNARYLAIVWPALAVLIAWSIQRLPLPWLRASAIGLLIGANAFQYVLRVSVESGVPVDQIAHDLALAKKSNGTVKTIVVAGDNPQANGLFASGGITDFPGKYYLAIESHLHLKPHQLRDQPLRKVFDLPTDVVSIPSTCERVVVWADGHNVQAEDDPILQKLGVGWIRTSSQEHQVRDFWCWRTEFRCRRSVYTRESDGETASETPRHKNKAK